MNKPFSWIFVVFIVFGFIGFLDAAYLTIKHYQQGILPCYIFEGCDKVANSPYAAVGGIPVSLAGAVYYFLILIGTIFYLDARNEKILWALKRLPTAGFLATLWFVYLQLFVIKAICLYCMISAVSSTVLFILSFYLMKLPKKETAFSL